MPEPEDFQAQLRAVLRQKPTPVSPDEAIALASSRRPSRRGFGRRPPRETPTRWSRVIAGAVLLAVVAAPVSILLISHRARPGPAKATSSVGCGSSTTSRKGSPGATTAGSSAPVLVEKQFPPQVNVVPLSCSAARGCTGIGTRAGELVLLSSADCGANWSIDSPVPDLQDASAATCTGAGTCVVSGLSLKGTYAVELTSDWGRKWSNGTLPAEVGLSQITCLTTKVCLAPGALSTGGSGGPENLFLRSTDGGRDWHQVAGGAEELSCPTEMTCFGLTSGSSPDGGSNTNYLTSTSDAGLHWTTARRIPGSDAASLACPTRSRCVVLEGPRDGAATRLLTTNNAGGSFLMHATPDEMATSPLACTSADDCLAFGIPVKGESSPLFSRDGGSTWKSGPLTPLAGTDGSLPTAGVICQTSFCAFGGTDREGQSVVLRTYDAGERWSSAEFSNESPSDLHGVWCTTAERCVAVGAATASEAGEATTSSGGSGWSGRLIGFMPWMDAVACTSSLDCVAVGQQGVRAIWTSNGGVSWRPGSVPSGVSVLEGVACSAGARCTAVGYSFANNRSPVIVFSSDGGRTWVLAQTPKLDPQQVAPQLTAVTCQPGGRCVAVGFANHVPGTGPRDRPLAYVSTDAGAQWRSTTVAAASVLTVPDLLGVSCSGPSTCVAVGSAYPAGAGVAMSRNGGTTWTVERIGDQISGLLLRGVTCVSVTTCVAVGSSFGRGQVLVTTDGGSTWTSQTVPSSVASLESVSCPAATRCVAVGRSEQSGGVVVGLNLG